MPNSENLYANNYSRAVHIHCRIVLYFQFHTKQLASTVSLRRYTAAMTT